jgi:glycosyltransferase involved in cell wall biosynthesis
MPLFKSTQERSREAAEAESAKSREVIASKPLPRRPLVSVVMPCLNVAETIVPVLEHFERQTYREFEVIINLDRRSKDGSEALIRPFCERDPRFKLIFENTGMAQGRNAGKAASSGEYLLNFDSDLAPTPTVIEEAVWRCEVEGADIVICPELSVTNSFWGECRALEKIGYLGDPLQESSGRFMRRKVSDALGGADEALLAGEDYDYFLRALAMGFQRGRIHAISWHHEYWTLKGKAKKLHRYGRSFPPYFKKYPVLGAKQFFPVRHAYLTHIPLYLSDPIHTAGLIVSNGIFYAAAGWGLALGYWDLFKESRRP